MTSKVKRILIITLIVLVAIQFIRPARNEAGYQSVASFEAETKPSAQVASILKQQCYDCHSNNTVYPWYAEISPVSLWLNDHIKDGKKHFNVSNWEAYSTKKKQHKLDEIVEMVADGEMPLKSYSLLHPKISYNEKELLLHWTRVVQLQYNSSHH